MVNELKEGLHMKFIEYIDLFTITWLLLIKKLHIYNKKSYNTIKYITSTILKWNLKINYAKIEEIIQQINLSHWNAVFNKFFDELSLKFDLKLKNNFKFDQLSELEFNDCAITLGRKPFGLYSTIKKCTCKFKLSDDFFFTYTDFFVNNHINYDDCCNESCVGIVSPFILSHKNYKFDERTFQLNHSLYSKGSYPLDSILRDECNESLYSLLNIDDDYVENVNSNEEFISSHEISKLIFEFIDTFLENGKPSEKVYNLALIIDNLINENHQEIKDSPSKEILVTSPSRELLHIYGSIINKIVEFIPFPTIYWLIDKNLISLVSKMEGNGSISKIQERLDFIINGYHERGDLAYKKVIEDIIKDNLVYILKRFQLVHPLLMELLYNLIVNSDKFSDNYGKNKTNKNYDYILLYDNIFTSDSKLDKALSILNTIRVCGIGGCKDFIHIKCLHSNLAFELAQGSFIGNIISHKLH